MLIHDGWIWNSLLKYSTCIVCIAFHYNENRKNVFQSISYPAVNEIKLSAIYHCVVFPILLTGDNTTEDPLDLDESDTLFTTVGVSKDE